MQCQPLHSSANNQEVPVLSYSGAVALFSLVVLNFVLIKSFDKAL